jgi:uncharacterized membrane protein
MIERAETILNVDDTEAIRYAKTRTLRRAGFTVVEAGTGAEALRPAAQAARAGAPLPPRYHAHAKLWFALGWPAFLGVLAIFC